MSRRTAQLARLALSTRTPSVRFGTVADPDGIPTIGNNAAGEWNHGGNYLGSGPILRKLVKPNPNGGRPIWGDGEEFTAFNVCPFALKYEQPVVCYHVPADPSTAGSVAGWVARPWFEGELPYLRVTLADVEVEMNPDQWIFPPYTTSLTLEITAVTGWLAQYIGVQDGTTDVLEMTEPYGSPVDAFASPLEYEWHGRGYFTGNIDFGGAACKLEFRPWKDPNAVQYAWRVFAEPQSFNFYLADVTLDRATGGLACSITIPGYAPYEGTADIVKLTNLELRLMHGHTVEFWSRP